MASRSGSEEKKPRRQQQQTYESEGEESEEYQPPQRQRKRNQRQQKGGQGPLDNLALDNVQNTAGGLVNSATGALGGVAGNAVQQQGDGGKGKSDTLRLRLDLNLDIEITLKAKIHGDLELALLRNRLHILGDFLKRVFIFSSELEEDDVSDIGQGGHNDDTQQQQDTPGSSKSPAYVAPISKIGHIPPISQPGIQSAPDRPALPPFVGELLLGKPIDEDGDIVDEKTGQVLAHAAGDLPSMIGRSVSNAQGDILGDDGELLGYVADIEWPRARPPPNSAPRSLFDLMGRTTSSLMVDHAGNILDANGAIVGTFHDNNNPLHRKEKEEKEAREREHQPKEVSKEPAGEGQQQQQKQQQQQSPSPPPPTPPQPQPQQQQQAQEQSQSQSTRAGEDSQPRPGRTDEERRQNAEDWRKENPNESPSDIFLDVKSTREGIQLIIRIPTVFNGQQTTPHISFS
ncbi:hypothetical protein C8A00DRAFT_47081 [Chaetomidium leptoderma]|uniref:Uncharacterized protein n=1 Tax=Chaetomidium leptoderma TaxID=669021 RepID=A0AAN6VDW0_9PEZI|nr:hypothetical protein C8A00DRAFT_47081 [Chaetomidium leptoderma]